MGISPAFGAATLAANGALEPGIAEDSLLDATFESALLAAGAAGAAEFVELLDEIFASADVADESEPKPDRSMRQSRAGACALESAAAEVAVAAAFPPTERVACLGELATRELDANGFSDLSSSAFIA